jgi:3-polyprenyl-4-hydroxybenzoate decarboxylase
MSTDTGLVTSIILGAVALIGGLWALVRFVMRIGIWINTMTEASANMAANTRATRELTQKMDELKDLVTVDHRAISDLDHRLERLETGRR